MASSAVGPVARSPALSVSQLCYRTDLCLESRLRSLRSKMAECYNCGANVPKGQGYRREVYTGHTTRMYYGRRVSGSSGRRYGIHTLCQSCAVGFDKRRTNRRLLTAGIVLALILAGAFSSKDNGSSHPSATSASMAGGSSSTVDPSKVHSKRHRTHGRVLEIPSHEIPSHESP